jgi:hypothetical protein
VDQWPQLEQEPPEQLPQLELLELLWLWSATPITRKVVSFFTVLLDLQCLQSIGELESFIGRMASKTVPQS